MLAYHWTMIFHLLGFGLLCSSVIGSWILGGRYRRAEGWKTKRTILGLLRPIGLLSPVASGVMLLSGIGNLVAKGYEMPLPSWLHVKLAVFVIVLAAGFYSGICGKRRGAIIAHLADGDAPANAETAVVRLDRRLQSILMLQVIALLVIIVLSVVKP